MFNVLVIEVIVGVLVGVILSGLGWLYANYLRPLRRGFTSNTPRIAGRWQGFKPDSDSPTEQTSELEIKQTGTRIRATVKRWNEARDQTRVFKYHGEFSSGQLVLFFEDVNAPGYITGTMVLKLSSNLNELAGLSTYYHHDEGKVVAAERLYTRV